MAPCLHCGRETGSPYVHYCAWDEYLATHAPVWEALEHEVGRLFRNGGE